MVEFVYGVPGSGKTSYIMSRLCADARAGRRAFLIVPEQQTVDVERTVAERLPPSAQLCVEALNFSRLANRVFRERGGLVCNYADKSRKLLFVWRALRECLPFLGEYGAKAASDPSLPAEMLNSIREFKSCGITPEELADAARKLSRGPEAEQALGAKLSDISLIYSAYTALLGQSYTDSDDDLSRLAAKLADAPYFGGTSVYIDSFSSFTGQQHAVIRLIMRQAEETVITLPLASPADRSLCSLSSRKCSDTIRRDASELGIRPEIICLGENRRAENAELRAVCKRFGDISAAGDIPEEERGHIELYSLCDPYSECDAAAARIKALIMGGCRCRDIAVIARDAEKYRGIIDSALEKLDIPYFLSEKTGFASRPLARLILSALRIKNYGWRREDVIAHLKTGLCGIDARDVDIFEAYTEKWNISGRSFYAEEGWSMNPDGYVTRLTARGSEALGTANRVRVYIRDRLVRLFSEIDASGDTAGVCRALWKYLDSLKVRETLTFLAARELSEGRQREAEEDGRLYDSAADALECLCDVFDAKPDLATFAAALRLAFDAAEIGTIPTGCDEVMIGSADMLRAGERKCVIILGMNEGEFPLNAPRGGLLTDRDRASLSSLSIDLSGGRDEAASDELFYILRAFSVPSERLCVFSHEKNVSGSACNTSSAFRRIGLICPYINIKTEKDVLPKDRIWSKRTAFEYISMYAGTPLGDALRRCLDGSTGFSEAERGAFLPLSARREALPPDLAREVFGERVELTQSRLESFVGCPCGYYLKYVLRLNESSRAEFGYAGMGSFVHKVLERFLISAGDRGFDALPDKEYADKLLDGIVTDYTASLGEPAVTLRITHRIKRMRRISELLLADIFDEFASGSFRPAAFELPIGMEGEGRGVPAAEFPIEGGGSAVLRGIADRVDTANVADTGETLIRVLDYKTGSRDFSLDDMKRGFDLQLPIYLYSLTKTHRGGEKNTRFGKDPVPAAITCLSANIPAVPLERPLCAEEVQRLARKSIRRSGLAVDRAEVLDALSADRDPHLMQGAKYSGDGTPSAALIPPDGIDELFSGLEKTISRIAGEMRSGKACAAPVVGSGGRIACDGCPYAAVCRAAIPSK